MTLIAQTLAHLTLGPPTVSEVVRPHPGQTGAIFLAALSSTPLRRFPSVGIGETLRFDTGEVVGAGLAVNEVLIHLSAFSTVD